jgi:Lytic transglycolase
VEELRATRAKGRLAVVALAAVTMLAAPLALLHGAASAATGTTASGGPSATASSGSLGATQLVSANAPDLPPTRAELARHRSAVRHNDQLIAAAARRRSDLRHQAELRGAALAESRAARLSVLRHNSAVRHNQELRSAAASRHQKAESAAAARRARRQAAHSRVGGATWYAWHPGQCASPFLPHGTLLTVTDLATGKTITCLVTDTEAHNPGRVVDLSQYCFEELGPLSQGVIQVRITW